MTRKSVSLVAITILLLAIAALGASVAWAGGANALIEDASDGVVDGTYSASTVRAALTVVRGDPAYAQYSDVEGVMVDYLAAVTGSGGGTSNPDAPGGNGTGTSGDGSLGITSSSGGTASPTATGTSTGSSGANGTGTATPTTSDGDAAATASPPPATTGWEQTKSRAAAVPWLFALVAGGVIVGVVLLRRRRRSS